MKNRPAEVAVVIPPPQVERVAVTRHLPHEQLVLAGLHTCKDVQIWSWGVSAKHMLRYVALADSVVAMRVTELVFSLAQEFDK